MKKSSTKRGKKENLTKLALKNSAYQFATTFIAKIGGLIFTIMLARLLLPELFGIYNVVLSIVLIVLTFTDLGVGGTAMRYVSEALGKNNKTKARSYFRYLLKIRGLLLILAITIILLIAKPLAYNFFNKPLVFLPLIFSCLYILMLSLNNFLLVLFKALKDLSKLPLIELTSQIFKISLSLLALLILSSKFQVSGIFVAFTIASCLSFILAIILFGKNRDLIFGKIIQIEKPRVLNYLKFMSIASISLVFFGSIDTLMLARFVEAAYIGYYRVGLSLVYAVSGLLAFSGILLPIFIQINKQRVERAFQKTFRYLIMLTIPATFGLIFVAKYFILAIYGSEYLLSTSSLYILSFLIITLPLVGLYSIIFSAKEKPKFLAKFIVISLIINIVLNYILIKSLVNFSQEYAIIGVGFATVISRVFYLSALAIKAKTQFKIKPKTSPIIKSVIASIVMVIFLVLFNYCVDINLFLGIVEIIFAVLVYFGVLWLIKGIGKEDLKIVKDLVKK